MRIALLILLAVWYTGCTPTDVEPPEAVSFSYRNDGTRRIAPTAVPKVTARITDNPYVEFPSEGGLSTTPCTLPSGQGFCIGTQSGAVGIFDANDSLINVIALTSRSPVFRIATTQETIVALQVSGALTAMKQDGTILWKTSDSLSRADLVLTPTAAVLSSRSGVQAFALASGKQQFTIATHLSATAAVVANEMIYVVLSADTAGGTDSIYAIKANGTIERRYGFPGLRITSNLAATEDGLTFAAQGAMDPSGTRRQTFIVSYRITGSEIKQQLRKELEYIATNVSVSGDIVLASGFQMGGTEYVGAIDAFNRSSGEELWQRRFTEPVGTVAVTSQHAFFPLSFQTEADIPSSGILVALDLPTGETAREVAVTDARNGFVPGVPIPSKGSLLLVDALTHTIYRLSPE